MSTKYGYRIKWTGKSFGVVVIELSGYDSA